MSLATRFGLLRHGQTVWNEQKRIQGRLDSDLTPAGREGARRWGSFLAAGTWQWRRIIASPAPRALKTAEIVNRFLGVGIEQEEGLREQDWGAWEGMRLADIRRDPGQRLEQQIKSGWAFRPPGGESRRQVLNRARAALDSLGQRYPGEDILVICHQGVIKALVYNVENRTYQPDEPELIDKNSLQMLVWHDQVLSAAAYNITVS
jgi:broad specificity phosphatase PhoE